MLPLQEVSPLPKAVRTFATLSEALNFIVECLERETPIQLLGEIHGVGQQVGRSRALIDRFKSVFTTMQRLHREHDLRRVYAGVDFPQASHFQVGGLLAETADLSVRFVRLENGWALDQLDYL